jgi:MYXO-CTERM domain-containing protein
VGGSGAAGSGGTTGVGGTTGGGGSTGGSGPRDGSTDQKTTSDGGGCSCDVTPPGATGPFACLVWLALVFARRRRRGKS